MGISLGTRNNIIKMDIHSNNSNFELFIKLEWLRCKKESIREF